MRPTLSRAQIDELFAAWLTHAKWLLPPKMSISEARNFFMRIVKEKEEIDDEKSS